jgi:hypothetical protein
MLRQFGLAMGTSRQGIKTEPATDRTRDDGALDTATCFVIEHPGMLIVRTVLLRQQAAFGGQHVFVFIAHVFQRPTGEERMCQRRPRISSPRNTAGVHRVGNAPPTRCRARVVERRVRGSAETTRPICNQLATRVRAFTDPVAPVMAAVRPTPPSQPRASTCSRTTAAMDRELTTSSPHRDAASPARRCERGSRGSPAAKPPG